MMELYCHDWSITINASGVHNYRPDLHYLAQQDDTEIGCNYAELRAQQTTWTIWLSGTLQRISRGVGTSYGISRLSNSPNVITMCLRDLWPRLMMRGLKQLCSLVWVSMHRNPKNGVILFCGEVSVGHWFNLWCNCQISRLRRGINLMALSTERF